MNNPKVPAVNIGGSNRKQDAVKPQPPGNPKVPALNPSKVNQSNPKLPALNLGGLGQKQDAGPIKPPINANVPTLNPSGVKQKQDTTQTQSPKFDVSQYNKNPYGPRADTDVVVKQEHFEQGQVKEFFKALKVVSGLAFNSKANIALCGGFALIIYGYESRTARDLDFLVDLGGIDAMKDTLKENPSYYPNISWASGENGEYLAFKSPEIANPIKVELVDSLKRFKTDEGVFTRAVNIFDNKGYRVTRCVALPDLFDLKVTVAGRRQHGDDLPDLKWLVKKKSAALDNQRVQDAETKLKVSLKTELSHM